MVTLLAAVAKAPTRVTDNAIINHFLAWWPHGKDFQVRLIRPSMLDECLAHEEPRLRNVTYNRYAGFLKQLFDIAVKDRIIAESPAKQLRQGWKKAVALFGRLLCWFRDNNQFLGRTSCRMPKPRKRREARTPQAAEFVLALQAANEHGSATVHKGHLAEWQFIDQRKHDCPSEEKRYLLEYELAREAQALGRQYRSTATWTAVFGSHFPGKAFLSIPPRERRECLRAAFSAGNAGVSFFDFTDQWQGLSYRFRYALCPEYQAQLDTITMAERKDENIEPADHTRDAAVANFMGGLPETAFDRTVAHVQMTIRFDYSDDALKDAFSDLLASLRRRDSKPGQKNELDARLKQLAAARLHRIFGTVQAAQDYLVDCGFELPYADAAGWSKARTVTKKLLGVNTPAEPVAERA